MKQIFPSLVLRAHNSEDSGIFNLFIWDREGYCIHHQGLQFRSKVTSWQGHAAYLFRLDVKTYLFFEIRVQYVL